MSEPPSAEASGVPQYRAVMLATDGSVLIQIRITALGDEEAKSKAKSLVDGHAIDLWNQFRFIERFEPVELGIADRRNV